MCLTEAQSASRRSMMAGLAAEKSRCHAQETAKQHLEEALQTEERRLAEAQRSIEALKAAAGADKESTIATLQVCTHTYAKERTAARLAKSLDACLAQHVCNLFRPCNQGFGLQPGLPTPLSV